jgi:hypothetical protein
MSKSIRVKPKNKQERRVLNWINEVRAKVNRRPVRNFIKGQPNRIDSCVVALTIGKDTETDFQATKVYRAVTNSFGAYLCDVVEYRVANPEFIQDFTSDYDDGKYPWLEEKEG